MAAWSRFSLWLPQGAMQPSGPTVPISPVLRSAPWISALRREASQQPLMSPDKRWILMWKRQGGHTSSRDPASQGSLWGEGATPQGPSPRMGPPYSRPGGLSGKGGKSSGNSGKRGKGSRGMRRAAAAAAREGAAHPIPHGRESGPPAASSS
jgi:hypothetical protein